MSQYGYELVKAVPGKSVLLIKRGDFYLLRGSDNVVVGREVLGLTVVTRHEDEPTCSFFFTKLDEVIDKLRGVGYKVLVQELSR